MNDDLNTAIALSVMFDLVALAYDQISMNAVSETLTAIDNMFMKLGGDVLGIVKEKYSIEKTIGPEMDKLKKLLDILMEKRAQARKKKQYEISDIIRDAVIQSDITVMDDEGGASRWEVK